MLDPFIPGGRTAEGGAAEGVLGLGVPTVCHGLSEGAAGYMKQNDTIQRSAEITLKSVRRCSPLTDALAIVFA